MTTNDQLIVKSIIARLGGKTKDVKPTPAPLFAGSQSGLAAALHKERAPDSLDLGILKAKAANKARWETR